MTAAAYGRLGQDPKSITTQSGKSMAAASMAVVIAEQEAPPLWVNILAFGRTADDLLRLQKGDMVSASGRVQRSTWTGADGTKHEQLQIIADSLVSSRTVRPHGGSRKQSAGARQEQLPDLNDHVPF
ncbi:single-stranded DNA-binding protein [Neorhizobium sp. P12A]|nr:single-stranded DNA-binding protein [Neorhizobium sp. P12A]